MALTKKPKPPAVVFDFDGPLFDGRKAAQNALFETYARFEPKIVRPTMAFDALPLLGPKRLISLLYPEVELPERQIIQKYYADALHRSERSIGISDSVRNALNNLKASSFTLTIFSARRRDDLENLLRDVGLMKYFDDIGCRPMFLKPSGDYLRHVAASTGLASEDVIFLGDSEWDYYAANDAAVPYFHAGWTGEPSVKALTQSQLTLTSISDFVSLLKDIRRWESVPSSDDPIELRRAVEKGRFSFYAGAGISVPSGVGAWEAHYHPVLSSLEAGHLEKDSDLPELVQLLAAEPLRAKQVHDAFSSSFDLHSAVPNAYHFAILRSGADHIWTSNYDDLFEKAITSGHLDNRIVRNDAELLKSFRLESLVVKMNGDFKDSEAREDLDWGLVFLQEQFDKAERDRPEIWRLFEDDYRQRSIVFIGVSFRDPVLRRIVTVARQKITCTRQNHYLVVKRDANRLGRIKQKLFAANLLRSSIVTIFKDSIDEITEFVQTLAVIAHRPIIGFSGSVGHVPDEDAMWDTVPAGMRMTSREISSICSNLGGELARKGWRVTSGCAPFVGIPAVEAAFKVDPAKARFYLRQQVRTTYRRTAPVVVVPGHDYSSMRKRFIPEASALIALGGQSRHSGRKSGTLEEIEMALALGIPVILLKAPGGDVESHWEELLSRMEKSYRDDHLRQHVVDLNSTLAAVPADSLVEFTRDKLPDLVEDLLRVTMGSEGPFKSGLSPRNW